MAYRRTILKGLGSVLPLGILGSAAGCAKNAPPTGEKMSRDYYKELGVKPFINAAGAYSALGGARMRPQVVA